MSKNNLYDVIIIGAGPSGRCGCSDTNKGESS